MFKLHLLHLYVAASVTYSLACNNIDSVTWNMLMKTIRIPILYSALQWMTPTLFTNSKGSFN